MDAKTIWLYIVVMAGVTYLIRRNDGARHL